MPDDEKIKVTRSCGNVFADLGLPNADVLLIKTDLAIAIKNEIDSRGWSAAEASEHIFVLESQISQIRNMKLEDFSCDRLYAVLRNLGVDVTIQLRKRDDGGIGALRVDKPSRQ